MRMTLFEIFYIEACSDERFKADFRWRDVESFCQEKSLSTPAPNHLKPFRTSRGIYNFSKEGHGVNLNEIVNHTANMSKPETKLEPKEKTKVDLKTFVPVAKPAYIPFGVAEDVRTIINSGRYISAYITGDTGYGKTMIVTQEASRAGREVIRVNCTPYTTEDELIGHYILKDGSMIWKNGPVLFAMERGAILLLDEVDALDPKRGAFCLFPLLEGEGVYVKKLNKRFMPTDGFNIFATANTKGKGDTRGRHAGTNVQNEAFLDRFKVTLEHNAPDANTEKKILSLVDEVNDSDFIAKVVSWCNTIRATYKDDGCDEVISTRRACDIISLYSVFENRMKVIKLAVAKFDSETADSFIDLYDKYDDTKEVVPASSAPDSDPTKIYPF